MTKLLTEIASYDEPGSWGRASEGWPEIRGDRAYDMYVFANCIETIPYGSYILMSKRGRYGASESRLRVHAGHASRLETDFSGAGCPDAEASIARRKKLGKLRHDGLRERAPRWW